MKVLPTLAALLFAAAASAPARAADVKIRFADLGLNADDAYQYLALTKGIYRKFGLDVERTSFLRGGPTLAAAAASQQVDLGDVGTPILTAISKGLPLKIVGAPAMKRQEFVLVARPDVANLSALEGQAVGVSSLGGGEDQSVRKILAANHLSVKGVKIVAFGPPQAGFATLQSNRLAAVVLSEPEVSRSVAAGVGKILAKAYDYYGDYEQSYIFASDSFIAAHPDAISAYFKANKAAIDYAAAHPEELIAFGAAKLNLSNEVARKVFESELKTWDPSQSVDVRGLLNAVRTVQQLGDIDADWRPKISQITDFQFNGQSEKDAANEQ